jgi:hypothetical protein
MRLVGLYSIEKSYVLQLNIKSRDSIIMQDGKDEQIKSELIFEIQSLEEYYLKISNYLSGTEYDALEMIGTLKVFRDMLDRISAHILTFYTLKGQRTKITWEQLLINIGNALDTLKGHRSSNPRVAIQAALNMSEPNIVEVMSFLGTLKKSLQ